MKVTIELTDDEVDELCERYYVLEFVDEDTPKAVIHLYNKVRHTQFLPSERPYQDVQ